MARDCWAARNFSLTILNKTLDKGRPIDTLDNSPHCGGYGKRAMPYSDQHGGWQNLLFSLSAATRLHEVRADLVFAYVLVHIFRVPHII